MASALIEELKIVATKSKRSQIKEANKGCSAQVMGSRSGGRGTIRERDRNSTGRSGSRRREGGGEGEGRGGGEGGGGGCAE